MFKEKPAEDDISGQMRSREVQESAERKTLTMERSVAQLRALVISANVISYLVFLDGQTPRRALAWVVICLAVPYGAWSLVARPYLRYPLLRFGALTLAADALLIALWILGTGGAQSEFWVIYVVSIISVGMRYDLAQTLAAAAAEAALYLAVLAYDGGLPGISLAVRPTYLLLAGMAAGLLARQERVSRDERAVFERIAREHREMLDRERLTVERLQELDEMRREFITNASHELRTPLTTLIGAASTLSQHRDEMTDEMIRICLEAMERQGDRARTLIDNLLDLSILDRGKRPPVLRPVDVHAVVAEALEIVPPPNGTHVDLAIGPELRVLADDSALRQVLVNLLTNAYRYGGRRITLTARAGEDGEVLLAVGDDGRGIPDDVVPKLFEAFGRGENVAGVPGSGLGLAISRRLVESFGGEITYQAAEPGANFELRLHAAS